ncbi:glycine cleavage system H protein-like isoform X2 [Symsagittifera roscoffensis]|uniref:glycine cleavage system H protein-like isoform X2 n=1 Tax=Symsagittifera roscoffensis TaxID=84072 RepID=UPI00307C1B88
MSFVGRFSRVVPVSRTHFSIPIWKSEANCLLKVNFLSSRSFSRSRILRERFYTESHEWVLLSDDKSRATIGISDHAQSSLGDVVFVELPELEKEVNVGDECGLVESTKSVSNIYSPVSGEVSEVNSVLEEKPGLINESPCDDGWICKLKVGDVASELSKLMNQQKYDLFLSSQES